MNKVINVKEFYRPVSDNLESVILIKLKNGHEVVAKFKHERKEPYLIDNSELINNLRALADYIENNYAQS